MKLNQIIKDCEYFYKDDEFITQIVRKELELFRERVKNNPGSSTRGKQVTVERLKKNVDKIDETIKNVEIDTKIMKKAKEVIGKND